MTPASPTRRDFLGLLAAGGVTLTLGQPSAHAQTPKAPPNILFILIDDLGYGDLGCYGNTFCDTPNIDRLAAAGMRFTQAYAPAPICSASRAGYLTGRTPARLGFEFVTKVPGDYATDWEARFEDKPLVPPCYTLDLPLEEQTVAEALKGAGYATGITGKWHVAAHHAHSLDWSPTHGPFQQGFDEGSEDYGAHPYGQTKAERQRFGAYEKGQYPVDALTGNAIEFMANHREHPFFLMVSHYYVHDPLATPCKWLLDKYQERAKGKYSDERALYGAFVETMDHYVGQLLNGLDSLGLAENTLVVLTSDNGGHPSHAFNTPLRGSKWNLYEGGIRVPFLVRWPGHIEAGSRCETPVAGIDLLPTFCAVSGAHLPEDTALDGQSIAPLLRGETALALAERPLYWHFPYYHPETRFDARSPTIGVDDGQVSQTRPHSAMRQGRFKVLYFYEDARTELYDLLDDPAEQHDLASDMPEKAQAMRDGLMAYLRKVNARFPRQKAARTFSSPDAHQGVAVGAAQVFTIDNTSIAMHDKATGALLKRWEAPKDTAFKHMNSAVVKDGRLYCAQSNYPEVPMRSALAIFDAATLEPVDQVDFGITDGSLTWMDWYEGHWWGCFVHYDHRPPVDKTNRDSTLVRFGSDWQRERVWHFPEPVLRRCAPYSISGGSWAPNGRLYVTGHDRAEAYGLRVPADGEILKLEGAVELPMHGQAIAFDRSGSGLLYGIDRKSQQVVTLPLDSVLAPHPLPPEIAHAPR